MLENTAFMNANQLVENTSVFNAVLFAKPLLLAPKRCAVPLASIRMTAKEIVILAMPDKAAVAPVRAYTPGSVVYGLPYFNCKGSFNACPTKRPKAAPVRSDGTKSPLGRPSP
eukprot:TRINITY_DN93682_c0_g1_i1.p3 TRINITY_DN93682_c0_g1~~TRINITY_DN93682_c0_g1_i1.p3  ORF type:complete len:113 (+),score=8.16 TRINITY_DN93682_c0_g1_i1:357-695(+)